MRIRRALAFQQKPWHKAFAYLNTMTRQLAKTDFEKDFF
jgi:hypothetical protein